MVDEAYLHQLWTNATDTVKKIIVLPSLWHAMEAAVPVAIENDKLVLGLPVGEYNRAGLLTTSDHRNVIEKVLEENFGRRLSFEVIEGTTQRDWELASEREKKRDEIERATQARKDRSARIMESWDELYERIGRAYANTRFRQFPQSKASFVLKAIEMISGRMDELMPQGMETDEVAQRYLARAIDKAGAVTGVPPVAIALELMRYRSGKK
jgi:hypothetical protein